MALKLFKNTYVHMYIPNLFSDYLFFYVYDVALSALLRSTFRQ